jgi:TPR repeat protein
MTAMSFAFCLSLAKLKVIGVMHDDAQAKAWYAKAVERGSAEAVHRLQQLAQRSE